MTEVNNKNSQELVIKLGFPVKTATYKTIKLMTWFLTTLLLCDLVFSCALFVSAIQIRVHFGYIINMISSGGGDTLPSLQAVPVFLFFATNIAMGVFLYMAFDEEKRPGLNRCMFLMVLLGFIMLIVMFFIIIGVIAHSYSAHESLHDGIVAAMKNYTTSTVYKAQIDHLQIELQCCGSKKYDEWYTIQWMDPSLEQEGTSSLADGHTPFSCCSMKSLFPCIHHNIEITGKAYLYTPEFNLSISTRGCYEMIREKKQEIGWGIVGNLFIFILLEGLTVVMFRFVQTAHFEKSRFEGQSHTYTIWFFGCYSGKVKRDPPDLPPIPLELIN